MNKTGKFSLLFILVFFLLASYAQIVSAAPHSEELLNRAADLFSKAYYSESKTNYERAMRAFKRDGNEEMAHKCKIGAMQASKILMEYSLNEKAAKKLFAENFKYLSETERNNLLANAESMIVDGEKRYLGEIAVNAKYRNLNLMLKDPEMMRKYTSFFEKVKDIVYRDADSNYPADANQPFINPVTYSGVTEFNIPRKKLPENGIFKVWLPLPVISASQPDFKIVSITPSEYLKALPNGDRDINNAYFEIPLDKVKDALKIKIEFLYTRYEQRFIIDPKLVGEYNKNGNIYKEYTRSYGLTEITPEIAETARQIAGSEKNPYIIAKKIYDYVVNDIKYSHMPHVTIGVLKHSESDYVHKNRFGDCGAQSMYFTALCRAAGIPARTTGGYQLIPGLAGSHFWAEFYLPNYGWIPVDTSIAQIADCLLRLTAEQKRRYREYFFGNIDPYRYVIQKDVDLELTPMPSEPPLIPGAIQMPHIECAEHNGLTVDFLEFWKQNIIPLAK